MKWKTTRTTVEITAHTLEEAELLRELTGRLPQKPESYSDKGMKQLLGSSDGTSNTRLIFHV